ncbi:MAG: hypothetical protein ACXWXU_08320 [Solirubrobacterales bacterium]
MNPLQRVRAGAGRAWFRSKRGTVRTASWVRDGVTDSFRKARSGVSGLRAGGEEPAPVQSAAGEGGPAVSERIGAANMIERVRSDQRLAIAAAVGVILLLAWIGWTIYVWTENGSTAGLGVLVSWPAVLAAAAIVATPFVGAGILVRRLRPVSDGISPSAAGDATGTEAKAGSTAETNDEESGEDEKPEEEETSDEDGSEQPEDGVEEDDSGDGADEDDAAEGSDEAAAEKK